MSSSFDIPPAPGQLARNAAPAAAAHAASAAARRMLAPTHGPATTGNGATPYAGASAGDARPAFGIHPDSINILWRSYRRMVEQAGTAAAWRRLRAAQARLEAGDWVGAMPPENRRRIGEIYARIAAWLQSVDMGGAQGAA